MSFVYNLYVFIRVFKKLRPALYHAMRLRVIEQNSLQSHYNAEQ